MLLAWMLLATIGIFVPRYMKETFKNKKICQVHAWFAVSIRCNFYFLFNRPHDIFITVLCKNSSFWFFFFFSNLRQNIFLRRKVLITSINVENGHAIEITSCLAIDTMFILLLPQEAAIYRYFIEKPYRRKLSYFTEKYLRWRPALVKLLAYDSK